MKDTDFANFLQWSLPHLHMRWAGFRRVRGQVEKRIARRIAQLGLTDLWAYREHLERELGEWEVLDGLCHVTISRFYRDRAVWTTFLSNELPCLVRQARERSPRLIRAWSAACAGGEEPYTLSIALRHTLASAHEDVAFEICATDVDEVQLRRAHAARYPLGCLRELPAEWRKLAFETAGSEARLKPTYRESVHFARHDLRAEPLAGPFDIVLCRNMAFTYFDDTLQRGVAAKLRSVLRTGGVLLVGTHEQLPRDARGFRALSRSMYVASPENGRDELPRSGA